MNAAEMQSQRDGALGCLILAVCVTLATFLNVFGKQERLSIEDARRAVAVHETLAREAAENLKQNQNALDNVCAALEAIKSAHR